MAVTRRPLAVVTGASSGIGRELALLAADHGYDLVVAADTPLFDTTAELSARGAQVEAVQTDLASPGGVDRLLEALDGRPVDALLANAGHGLGHAFLDQDFEEVLHVINTNITGTVYLVQKVGLQMRARRSGRILVTGSIAGFQPGSFQAVYNGTKAFIDSFVAAIRNENKDAGFTITCLMPGVTDTAFFARAGMLDTKIGTTDKQMDPAEVARIGFQAMQDGEADVVAGLKNKAMVAMSKVLPSQVVAEQHRRMAEPGTAKT
ncbi:SDR family NAD(P)-dependent oxidoreductase [Xylophilus sp.]|uniref:SDR family NAD(P)-dependent oxidoreductase n=1 Tax=Xylophilus sp. TaxID=2653893 RepID=UPI002D7FA4D5|nr:SDR family NAD(P)-dependent oxidoreductase [Xylophilus sp.]